MKSLKLAFSYGFLLWLIPFLASVIIFPLKKTDPAFFQSLLGVTSIILAVILVVYYFKKTQGGLKEGILLGAIFLFMSLFFDFFFFIWGPIKMPLATYLKEIAIGYLTYFAIATGYGYLLGQKNNQEKAE